MIGQPQHTVARDAVMEGVGVHSGILARVRLRPATAGTGVIFIRTDLAGDNAIPALASNVVDARLNTRIANGEGAEVSTIEHLMAALWAVGIDNARVEIDGPETPILDGTASRFLDLVDAAGRAPQDAERRVLRIVAPVEVTEGGKVARLRPADGLQIAVEIDFPSRAVGRQAVDLVVDEATFRRGLAGARTFGFRHEVEALRAAGLARGGSLDNAVVVDGDAILNPGGLRWPDEFARHKAVDAIGDLYTFGHSIVGRYEGVRAGHALNNALLRRLAATPSAFRLEPA